MKPAICQFADLPDEAVVPVTMLAAVTSQGVSTCWRKAKTDRNLTPIKLGNRCTRFRVGGIRAYMRGEVAE